MRLDGGCVREKQGRGCYQVMKPAQALDAPCGIFYPPAPEPFLGVVYPPKKMAHQRITAVDLICWDPEDWWFSLWFPL